MSTMPAPFSMPLSLWRVDRLDIIGASPSTFAVGSFPDPRADWAQVDQVVQDILGAMAGRIRRQWPSIGSQASRTSARAFFLFAYRTFRLADDEASESVIVGLTFEPAPSGERIIVRGDIGGEETGRIDFETPVKEVPNAQAAVLATAYELARELADREDVVVRAVFERHAPPDY
jgi:hypothetical protein